MTTAGLLALVAGGCVTSSDGLTQSPAPGKYGSGVTGETQDGPADLGPRGGEGPTVKIPSGGGSSQSGGSSQGVGAGTTIDDDGELGVNAELYLSRRVPRLVVEIDAVKGYEPSPTAINTLKSRLESVVDKPAGVDVLLVETFTDDRAPWTASDLAQAEERNRDHYSTKDVMILYVLYVNGSYTEREDALGVAYSSSTYAVFPERIREAAATPLVPATAIEQAVIVHEMGHVFALVNIGYESPRDHEDPDHSNHSKNPNSVMYWAVDSVGVANLLGGRPSPPTNFDADDKADLEDLKQGRLRVD